MQLSNREFYQQGSEFIEAMLASLAVDGIDVQPGSIDHLCYRAATQHSYAQAKRTLQQWGGFVSENQIGGRPIAVYLLNQPVVCGAHRVTCIELTSPKPGRDYAEGFEHIEVVIADELQAFAARHAELSFDLKGVTKSLNADLRLCYAAGSVKFHNQSLEQVIELERGSD